MTTTSYSFDIPKHHKSIIKVIGVGGGGSNAVNHMFNQGIKDVEFVICNTDSQALMTSPVPNRIQIGLNLTEGLGVGANPEKGMNAALESKDQIREMFEDGTKMLFVTAGMGGGTGTGAAPVIAKIAKDMDVLTVGIVTAPFAWEGKKKIEQAYRGIEELKECCDTVLVISNDKLREIYGNLPISKAFAEADNILTTAAKGIAEIITVPGYVNVDFQDVRTVMLNAGAAVMGSSVTEGESRARRAAEEAISSPLLDNKDIDGAKKILLSIVSGDSAELQMDELSEITDYIQEMAGDEAEVIFGHGVDPELGNSIRVTVIATGFDEHTDTVQEEDQETKYFDLETTQQISIFDKSSEKPSEPEVQSFNDLEIEPVENKPLTPNRMYEFEVEEQPANETKENEPEEGLFGELKEDFEVVDSSESDESISEDGMMELKMKRQKLEEEAQHRVRKLSGLNTNNFESGDFKEKLDVPAYLRRNVNLEQTPHSSERNISKFNLTDDNQILGNNRFLHDNVD